MKTIYTDAHCHLGSREFDADRQDVLARMMEKEVDKVIMICCSRHDLDVAEDLQRRHAGFKLAIGIHPQDLEEDNGSERLEAFARLIEEKRPDMIGEIGLDYYSHPHTKEHQLSFFQKQLELASVHDLPVDIHSRKATADTLNILKQYKTRGIIHSYSGSCEMAKTYTDMGFYLSFGASVLFPGAKRPAEVIRSVPLDKLLIETDAPYQSPIKDHRHEPADVTAIYEAVAAIKGMSIEELKRTIEDNFDGVFA